MRRIPRWFQKVMDLENLATIMGIFGHLALYVQASKIFYLESAHAVSLSAYIIGITSMATWLAYGLSRQINPLIISNIFGLLGAALVIWGVIRYQ